jgi:hypothetical protein
VLQSIQLHLWVLVGSYNSRRWDLGATVAEAASRNPIHRHSCKVLDCCSCCETRSGSNNTPAAAGAFGLLLQQSSPPNLLVMPRNDPDFDELEESSTDSEELRKVRCERSSVSCDDVVLIMHAHDAVQWRVHLQAPAVPELLS